MIEELPVSALAEWRAYLNEWPSGEEAMDLRFEVLLRETINAGAYARYIARAMAGDKAAQPPAFLELSEVKLFNRIGQITEQPEKRPQGMSPEEASSKRTLFRHAVSLSKGRK